MVSLTITLEIFKLRYYVYCALFDSSCKLLLAIYLISAMCYTYYSTYSTYKHKKEKWMSSALLKSVVHKNKLYRDWKSTTDNNEYQIKQLNFKTYERIIKNMIEECKQKYYFDTFSAQKIDIKKTWATIDEKLN